MDPDQHEMGGRCTDGLGLVVVVEQARITICMSHSNIPGQVGNPRLVAGFSDAYFEESDGSAGSFFGTFVALREPFRVSGK